MAITAVVAALAAALFPQPAPLPQPASRSQSTPIPFDAAGKRVLEFADRALSKGATPRKEVRARLEPLHERVRLGAFELWIPKRILDDEFVARDGMSSKIAQPFVQQLIALEREWITRACRTDDGLKRARAALDDLESWSKGFRGSQFPAARGENSRALQEEFLLRALNDDEYAPVLILAPTRAQFIGLIGAVAAIEVHKRPDLLSEGLRSSITARPCSGVTVIALTAASERAQVDPLQDDILEPTATAQNFVHAASHVLSIDLNPSAPSWWLEGLAICDTIAICRADETLCSGCSETRVATGGPGAAGIFMWVTRQKSPYRESHSASYFENALRAASSSEGLQVVDLDAARNALRITPPLLGLEVPLPDAVQLGSDGIKKGFAELYRAYSTAFVHWLDLAEPRDGRSLLDRICVELRNHPHDPSVGPAPLYAVARQVSKRLLGATDDAELDLEAAFALGLMSR